MRSASLPLLLLLLHAPAAWSLGHTLPALPSLFPMPVGPEELSPTRNYYDSNRAKIPFVMHTCEDVIRKCNNQCNKDHQCKISCVACPNNSKDKCWVKPDQCRLRAPRPYARPCGTARGSLAALCPCRLGWLKQICDDN